MNDEGKSTAFNAPRDQKRFRIMVIASLAVHAGLLIAFFIGGRSSPRTFKTQDAIQTQLVRLGQVKPEWLPRVDTAPPPPKEEPAVVSPLSDSKAIETKAKAKDDNKSKFDDAMKRLNDLEKKSDDYKGKGDPSGSKQGTVSELTKQIIGNQWVSDVQSKIRPNLDVPSAIDASVRDSLKTVISLYVSSNGKVMKRAIEHGSGNELFDRAVLRAIDMSSPLPPPPPEIRDSVQGDGCEVTFTGRKG